jgi:hypothetical protein
MSQFGLTIGTYDAMLKTQDGRCGCCGDLPENGNILVLDHCHKTGRVRSLLCGQCNLGLGAFKDNPHRLQAAISYLTGGNH